MTPPLRKTATWWEHIGLGRAAVVEADWVLPAMKAIVSVVTDAALDAAVREAKFQVRELPTRTANFAATYMRIAAVANHEGSMTAIMAFEPIVAALLRNGFDGDELFDCLNEAICNVQESNPTDAGEEADGQSDHERL